MQTTVGELGRGKQWQDLGVQYSGVSVSHFLGSCDASPKERCVCWERQVSQETQVNRQCSLNSVGHWFLCLESSENLGYISWRRQPLWISSIQSLMTFRTYQISFFLIQRVRINQVRSEIEKYVYMYVCHCVCVCVCMYVLKVVLKDGMGSTLVLPYSVLASIDVETSPY